MKESGTRLQDPPQHGGQLRRAAQQFGIPLPQWLDLSTGINPFSWVPPVIPQSVWQRLPDSYQELEHAAKHFYGQACIAVPGSQWLIQMLPAQFAPGRVWVPAVGYEEYRYQWHRWKHEVLQYQKLPPVSALKTNDVVIVINPNNPTGIRIDTSELLDLAAVLAPIEGCLIVDEAFMDLTPSDSLLKHLLPENIIVLRSFGKFFGLAGIRLGFAHTTGSRLDFVTHHLGPWAINHPAAYIGEQALEDSYWQQINRERLLEANDELTLLLQNHFQQQNIVQSGLFCSVHSNSEWALKVYLHCARHGILVRLFEDWGILRFGLTDKFGLEKLDQILRRFAL